MKKNKAVVGNIIMYAIFKSGGKQYKVSENDVVKLEKIESANEGDVILLDQVLALGNGGDVTLGTPVIANVAVSAHVIAQTKDDKVIIFKKKRRHNYRRKKGHRQHITIVRILDVSGKGNKTLPAPKAAKVESPEVADVAVKKTPAPKAKKLEAESKE